MPSGAAGTRGLSSSTDAEGRFKVAVPPGTVWTLEVRGSPQSEAYEQVFLTLPGVSAGTRDLVLQLSE